MAWKKWFIVENNLHGQAHRDTWPQCVELVDVALPSESSLQLEFPFWSHLVRNLTVFTGFKTVHTGSILDIDLLVLLSTVCECVEQ